MREGEATAENRLWQLRGAFGAVAFVVLLCDVEKSVMGLNLARLGYLQPGPVLMKYKLHVLP